jgi:hypothetical protein
MRKLRIHAEGCRVLCINAVQISAYSCPHREDVEQGRMDRSYETSWLDGLCKATSHMEGNAGSFVCRYRPPVDRVR